MNGSDIDSRALLALQRSEKISLKKKEYLFGAVECPSELFSPSCAKLLDAVLGEVADEVRGFIGSRTIFSKRCRARTYRT